MIFALVIGALSIRFNYKRLLLTGIFLIALSSIGSTFAPNLFVLYLNNGVWDGNQLISLDWVSESTRTQFSDTFWPWEYGYGCWMFELGDGFSTLGSHGQMIYVSPENELVVVFTGRGSDGLRARICSIIFLVVLATLTKHDASDS